MKRSLLTLTAVAALSTLATHVQAGSQTFDFKDPKGVNNAVFKLDAPLEAITGSAHGVTGSVQFDPEKPGATTGRIVISTASLHVPNPIMKDHMLGEQWLNAAKNPEIAFEAKSLKNVQTTGNNISADVTGQLTIKGVTKEITAPVKFTYLKDKLGQRVPNLQGDLLVVRAQFTVQRTDFGINPGAPQDKVSDAIEISLSIAGAAPRK